MRTEINVIGGVGVAAVIGWCMVYSQGWGATQAVTEAPQVPIDDAVNQAALHLLTNPPCQGTRAVISMNFTAARTCVK